MPEPYKHKEAFCQMWYGCKCGHRERVYNSRDGVTPFLMTCPSCARVHPSMKHIAWDLDERMPEGWVPNIGQRVWVDLTLPMALRYLRYYNAENIEKRAEEWVNSYGGGRPYCIIWGAELFDRDAQ